MTRKNSQGGLNEEPKLVMAISCAIREAGINIKQYETSSIETRKETKEPPPTNYGRGLDFRDA